MLGGLDRILSYKSHRTGDLESGHASDTVHNPHRPFQGSTRSSGQSLTQPSSADTTYYVSGGFFNSRAKGLTHLCRFYGAVGFLNSSPSTRTLLSAVAGPLRPSDDPVPNLTLTPPLPTLTVRASADCKSALAPPTGWSGSGRLAWTRSMVSCLLSCSERSCWRLCQFEAPKIVEYIMSMTNL
jgi:hypothetical protein